MFSIYGLQGGSETPVEEFVVFGCVVDGGGWTWHWHWHWHIVRWGRGSILLPRHTLPVAGKTFLFGFEGRTVTA